MNLRTWLKRLERDSQGMMIIPQQDGLPKRFTQADLAEAFVSNTRRLCGEDEPLHPVVEAAQSSTEGHWNSGFFSPMHILLDDGGELEDLSG